MDNPLFVPGSFEGLGASLRGITLRHVATPTDIFVAILESRSVAETLVGRFDLERKWGEKSLNKAVKRLQKRTGIDVTQDGTIRIAALGGSAEEAVALANAYVEELDRVNRQLAGRDAGAIREFIEKELDDAKGRLAAAEDELRAFQERYGAVEIGEQARAVIGAAAEVRAMIMTAEVELGVLRRTRDDSHPEVAAARDYLNELRLRQAEIEGGPEPALVTVEDGGERPADEAAGRDAATSPEEAERDIFPPLSKVPALGMQFGRLLRELKTEEAVVTLLTEQFHRARIEERRSLPTVRVLDAAVPPDRRYRPRRSIFVLVATGAALVLAVMLAYGLEIVRRVRDDPVRYSDLHEIARDLRKGFRT
jgi:uncharacterized protein involved in exopolysaccharide biosynthesis